MVRTSELRAPREAQICTATLALLLRSGTPFFLLDARGPQTDDARRIPTARALSPKASSSEIARIVPSTGALIVTYCSNLHCPSGFQLAQHLKGFGYENVLHYSDGLAGWIAAGYPVDLVAQAPQPRAASMTTGLKGF